MKQLNISIKVSLCLFFASLISITSFSQVPAYGTTGFNDLTHDQVPFASGVAYPSVMTATNVANTGWSFHIGAIGTYVITQADHGTSTYNGAITATNVTPPPFPTLYQTFAFTSTNSSRFKLNSVQVKIDNDSSAPIPMILAGVISGANTGSTQSFVAMPGANWVTITTSSDPNFNNINGVIVINPTGTTHVREMAIDDINISAPVTGANPPVFNTQPADKFVCANATTTFSAAASNASSYFWLVSTDGLIWNPINVSNAGTTFSGYNTNTLTVTNPSTFLNGLYLAVTAVGPTGLNKGSNPARLFVTTPPTVAAITGASNVCVGSSIALANATPNGVWSLVSAGGAATINSSGSLRGVYHGGSVIARYTVTNGGCSNSSSKSIVVNALPAAPAIGYAPGTPNPQAGAPTGGFCVGKIFNVVGLPAGGSWSASGIASITNGGQVTINGAGTGSIKYTYTDGFGCSSSRTLSGNGFTCAARGINTVTNNQNKDAQEFSVFPNPTKGAININFDYATSGSQIVVTDIYGKKVITKPLSIGNNNIDISKLNKGLYLVTVNSPEGTKTQKLIVE